VKDAPTPRHVYREYLPAAELGPYVECYWHAVSDGPPGFRAVEPLIPDLKVELIFNAGDRYGWAPEPNAAAELSPAFTCIGMRATALGITQAGKLDHFAIRMRPAGLAAFSALPLFELTQRCIDVRELWGVATSELTARLGEARNVRERIAAADRFLAARLRARIDAGALARRCAETMQRSEAMMIGDIAERHGVGYKRLERAFLRDVGLTPKHFAKVARLQRALKFAIAPSVNLATAALESGYADQAHMTRDFKQLVGRAPRAFLAEQFAVFETMRASGSIGLRPFDESARE
jgi:AraC-like DNA-binding protein